MELNLRETAQSPYLDPFVVYKNHWLPWNWGYLSTNPTVPAWLVMALPSKPWDWISLAELPCSHTLHKRMLYKFKYEIHQKNHLAMVRELDEPLRRVYENSWNRRCALRIGNEVYRRIVIPRRRLRWLSIVKKIIHNRSHRLVNGTIASFLAPPASPNNNALPVIS